MSPVINHCPRKKREINGDVVFYGVLEVNVCFFPGENERHKTEDEPQDNVWKRERDWALGPLQDGDEWKRASIIGSQTPPGNSERIYRPWHFSCPWTCYLQIRRSIAGWNTTWREDLMIPTHTHTHTGHIFLAPLSYVNTWGKHKLRHAPGFNFPTKNQVVFFFVYKLLIMLMCIPHRPPLNRSRRPNVKRQNLCLCTSDGDERDVRFNL